jgi:hypothetical protein
MSCPSPGAIAGARYAGRYLPMVIAMAAVPVPVVAVRTVTAGVARTTGFDITPGNHRDQRSYDNEFLEVLHARERSIRRATATLQVVATLVCAHVYVM